MRSPKRSTNNLANQVLWRGTADEAGALSEEEYCIAGVEIKVSGLEQSTILL